MFGKTFPTFLYYLALASIVVCPCENNKDYLGIVTLVEPEVNPTRKKKLKLKHSFFLGNGIKEDDPKEAANKLLFRDHKDVADLNDNYYNGKLGPKFLPPIFYSAIPNVVNPSAYEDQTKLKPGRHKPYHDEIRGEEAERLMFDALQVHFNQTKDDVLILSSHKFLNDTSNNEKDFIIVNLSKGYVMMVEVKANSRKFQTAKKQFFDSKDRLAEVFKELSLPSDWKVVNLFYAQRGEVPFKCPKDN